MDIHPVDLLLHVLNIVVLFVLLRMILWKPIIRFLTARQEEIDTRLRESKEMLAEAAHMKAGYEADIGNLEERGRVIVRESEMKAAASSEEILGNARADSEVMLEEARARIEKEKTQAIVSAHLEVARLATDMAARILRREVTVRDTQAAVDGFFSEEGQS